MQRTHLPLLTLTVSLFVSVCAFAQTDVTVRVGLLGEKQFRVGGAPMTVTRFHNGEVLAEGSGEWIIRHVAGSGGPASLQVTGASGTFTSNDSILLTPHNSAPFLFEGKRYRGSLLVRIKEAYASAVNVVPLEDYLLAVLPAEIGDDAPMEALLAQSVAARTWTLFHLGKHQSVGYDFCTGNHCQAYLGTRIETERSSRAVRETRGEVLVYPHKGRDRVIDAVYSGCCGGVTRDSNGVWGGENEPYFRERHDWYGDQSTVQLPLTGEQLTDWLTTSPPAFCNPLHGGLADEFRWQRRLGPTTRRSIARRLGVGETVTDLEILRRASTGHVIEVRVLGDKSSKTVSPQSSVRVSLGNLKSTLFVVRKSGDDLVLHGGGIGHGVGLCQDGAVGMANLDHDYKAILEHYYPGSRVVEAGNSHFNKPDFGP